MVDQATPQLRHDISGELIVLGVAIVPIKLSAHGAYRRIASVTMNEDRCGGLVAECATAIVEIQGMNA